MASKHSKVPTGPKPMGVSKREARRALCAITSRMACNRRRLSPRHILDNVSRTSSGRSCTCIGHSEGQVTHLWLHHIEWLDAVRGAVLCVTTSERLHALPVQTLQQYDLCFSKTLCLTCGITAYYSWHEFEWSLTHLWLHHIEWLDVATP
jgi:hypothetical protein